MAKLYNKNMYRVINVMCFGDAASKIHKMCQPGTVLAILSPKFFPSKAGEEQLLSFTIDSEKNLVQIGYSFDYDVCKG